MATYMDHIAGRWVDPDAPNYGMPGLPADVLVIVFSEFHRFKAFPGIKLNRYFTVVENPRKLRTPLVVQNVLECLPLTESAQLAPCEFFYAEESSRLARLTRERRVFVPLERLMALPKELPHRTPAPAKAATTTYFPPPAKHAYVLVRCGELMSITLDLQTAEAWATESDYNSCQELPLK